MGNELAINMLLKYKASPNAVTNVSGARVGLRRRGGESGSGYRIAMIKRLGLFPKYKASPNAVTNVNW